MGKYIFIALIIIGAFLWVSQVHPAFAGSNSATSTPTAPWSFSLAPYTAGAIAQEKLSSAPPFDGDGVVFIDDSDATSPVPYLAYETTKHTLGIKELLFLSADQQDCQISAGEYPCAKDLSGADGANSDASPVPSGTPVHIVGQVDDQGIIVQNMQTEGTVPAGMVSFSVPLTTTAHVSDGTAVTPITVMDNASCTFGVGCYGQGTQRLEVTIASGGSSNTTELIPGRLLAFGKSDVILLSLAGSGNASVATFLVGTR